MAQNNWYIAGLNFKCSQCGSCCSGPEQGCIWVTKQEIEFIAEYLKITVSELRKKYLKRYGPRTSIIEQPVTKDCVFLLMENGVKRCQIYPVRPNQCRTWPFWLSNLESINTWNNAAQKCGGINRGRYYSFDQIEKIRKSKKWWTDKPPKTLVQKVAEIYGWLDTQLKDHRNATGSCEICGKCCDFEKYDHRLFVTSPEIEYLIAKLGKQNIKPMSNSRCPYNEKGFCSIHKHRFSGCRIFHCRGDKEFQSRLTEETLRKLKSLCEEFELPYRYVDLQTALNNL